MNISKIAANIKDRLSPKTRRRLSVVKKRLKTTGRTSNMNLLAQAYGTDKWGSHFYTQHYQRFFAPWRKKPLKILEIGVGGYADLWVGASSLQMWKRYFPKSQIVGIDLYDKSQLSENRITILQCDQTDAVRLEKISRDYGPFDIIIDDGSHLNDHVKATFEALFPLLKMPGYYAIEDLQTAYWPSWGGIQGQSSMDYLKSRLDGLNFAENPILQEPSYFDTHIREIHFFHNLCIIHKASNHEPSNCPELVKKEQEAISASAAP